MSGNTTERYAADSGMFVNDDQKKILKELADALAINYCSVSFSDEDKERVTFKELFKKPEKNHLVRAEMIDKDLPPIAEVRHRNILIIGTGATYDLYKCIPLGMQLIDELYAQNKGKFSRKIITEKFEGSLKEFNIKKKKPGFENVLSLLTKWYLTANELRDKVSNFVDFRYPPSLLYEIIAHMFKHSFIDVIINFNFDELLDNAIEEELGKENYFHILSDGDCIPLKDIMIDGRLKVPVYIKPHGTFKHKSSLRFTNQHYLEMPEPVKNLLKELIGGKTKSSDNRIKKDEDCIPVNLIGVGFNMESIEFNEILDGVLPPASKIYHVIYENEDENELYIKEKFPRFFKDEVKRINHSKPKAKRMSDALVNKIIYKRLSLASLKVDKRAEDSLTSPLCEIFSYVWRRAYNQFKPDYRPRSLAQHEIISYLFYNPLHNNELKLNKRSVEYTNEQKIRRKKLTNEYDKNASYFLDRALVEIAIAINRNNGIVELAQLLNDRVGKYFALYRSLHNDPNKKPWSIYDLINQFKSSNNSENGNESFYPKGILELDTSVWNENTGLFIENLDEGLNLTAYEDILKILKNKFIQTAFRGRPVDNPEYDKINNVTPVVLYYLFRSEMLSAQFRENFRNNYAKPVYNTKNYEDGIVERMNISKKINGEYELTMMDELERLFDKSNKGSSAYFSIHPKFNNPRNFLIESFSKSRILHTNLALEYKFKELFRQTDKWDELLIIAERTCRFEFLREETELMKEFINKKITIINSYEAIKQNHTQKLKEFDIETGVLSEPKSGEELIKFNKDRFAEKINTLNRLQEDQYRSILTGKAYETNVIDVSCLPAMQHNHHMMVFIKRRSGSDDNSIVFSIDKSSNNKISMLGALYMYRHGFSNNINPLYIGVEENSNTSELENDFKRLLRIFSKIHKRADRFGEFPESEDLDTDFRNQLYRIFR